MNTYVRTYCFCVNVYVCVCSGFCVSSMVRILCVYECVSGMFLYVCVCASFFCVCTPACLSIV